VSIRIQSIQSDAAGADGPPPAVYAVEDHAPQRNEHPRPTMTALMKISSTEIAHAFLAISAAMLAGCQATQTTQEAERSAIEPIPHVVTADIQAGIEKHIEDETRKGGGVFTLRFEGQELRLKLVRVHTEYLANLGPRRHFACVDLAGTDGNVYDVDFFLAGDPGKMTVTETTVHKINGRPLYVWEQNRDGTWARAAVDDASSALLGVIEGRDRFEFIYQATLPELADDARMWIPLPDTDMFQSVEVKEINTPGTRRILTDRRYGNKVLFLELEPRDSGKPIALRFEVERLEKSVYRDGEQPPQAFLAPERSVPINDEFRAIAAEVLDGKQGDLLRARALYDHTIDRMRYMKFGEGYGRGDAVYACDAGTGNCTDYHSYFIALARASGIPARFAIGAAIPSERDVGGVDGYHCWAEFYADDRWWPIDISEADKYTSLATYYFGHNPANRVELSRGRDLVVEPGPVSGPINFLAYPVLEVAGRSIPIKPQFAFRRLH
jgi:hypothetical protein